VKQVNEFAQVRFGNRALSDRELQGVWVRWDANCRHLEKFLFEKFSVDARLFVAVLPANWSKANRKGVEELSSIEAVSDPRHRVNVRCELNALIQGRALTQIADLGDYGFADGEEDVAILVGILDNWVFSVILEASTAGNDDLLVSVQGLIAGNKVDDWFGTGDRFQRGGEFSA